MEPLHNTTVDEVTFTDQYEQYNMVQFVGRMIFLIVFTLDSRCLQLGIYLLAHVFLRT